MSAFCTQYYRVLRREYDRIVPYVGSTSRVFVHTCNDDIAS